MDTKNWRHHKRTKKNKSRSNKGNTDVLVVPPDILKKLGISIGNTDPAESISNNYRIAQNFGTICNDPTTNNLLTINNGQQSSEASILETANLMKKSVFLSPTFVPTVANVIPGEIEITNSKHSTNPEVVRNDFLEHEASAHELQQKDSQHNLNGNPEPNSSLATVPSLNSESPRSATHRTKLGQATNTILDHDSRNIAVPSYLLSKSRIDTNNILKSTDAQMVFDVNGLDTCEFSQHVAGKNIKQTKHVKNNLNSSEIIDIHIQEIEEDLISLEGSQIQIDPNEVRNHLDSLEETAIQIEQRVIQNNLTSLEGSVFQFEKPKNIIFSERNVLEDQSEIENGYLVTVAKKASPTDVKVYQTAVNGTAKKVEEAETVNKLIFLKGEKNETHQQLENISTLEGNADGSLAHIDPTEVENQVISLEGTTFLIEATEIQNNIVSLDRSEIQIVSSEGNILQKNQIDAEVDLTEVENQIFSLEGSEIQIERTDIQSNSIPLESNINQIEQVENIIFLEGNTDMENTAKDENSLISLEPESANEVKQAECNNISGEKNNPMEATNSNDKPLEDNVVSKMCEDYIEDLIIADGKFELQDNNINCDLSEDGIISSLPIVTGDFSVLSENEILIQIEKTVSDQPDSNTILQLEKSVLEQSYKYDIQQDSCLKDISQENVLNGDLTCAKKNQGNVAKVNKITQKIKIISEEIMPAIDLKELKRARSPVIRALTPVPLNTIIGSKSIDNSAAGVKIKNNITNLSNDLELMDTISSIKTHESLIKARDCQHSIDEVDSTCNPKLCKTSRMAEDVCAVTEITGKGNCNEENLQDQTSKDKGLKNNTDIFSEKVIGAGVINDSKGTKHAEKDNTQLNQTGIVSKDPELNFIKLDNENKNGKHKSIRKKEINSIRHAYLTLTQGQPIQNCLDVESQQYFNECNENKTFGRSSCSDGNNSEDNIKANSELKSENKQITKPKKKLKKTKKKVTEVESISEISIDESKNKAISKNKDINLSNILKSTKDNSEKNTQIDKVKEIAEYIKKFAQMYKDKNKVGNKCVNNTTYGKIETINSKSNMTESKLCIQGVEKPGGNKGIVEDFNGEKELKTYTRKTKKLQQPCSSLNISDINETISITNTIDTDININDISISYKQRNFCLCYDFGRFNSCEYNNSYEHIHFWLHNNNSDLESILDIYKDDTLVYEDRTELDNGEIAELIEDNTETMYICWNYFMNDGKQFHIEDVTTSQIDYLALDESGQTFLNDSPKVKKARTVIKNDESTDSSTVQNDESSDGPKVQNDEGSDSPKVKKARIMMQNDESSSSENSVQTDISACKDSNKFEETKSNIDNSIDTHLCNVGYEIVIEDENNKEKDIQISESSSTIGVKLQNTERNYVGDNDSKNDKKKQATSKGPTEENISKVEEKQFLNTERNYVDDNDSKNVKNKQGISKNPTKESTSKVEEKTPRVFDYSTKNNRKRDVSARRSSEVYNVGREEPSSKKSVKCGVCNKLLTESEWEHHVTDEHYSVGWKAGNFLDINDPNLFLKLEKRLQTVGSLMCPICDMKTKKINKFRKHIKTCIDPKDQKRRRSSSKDTVTCGVCHQNVKYLSWIEHIGKQHNYLAWIEGQDVLNIDDEVEVSKHLLNIIKANGCLVCNKCGLSRKRAKLYLAHVDTCDGTEGRFNDTTMSMDLNSTSDTTEFESTRDKKIIKCGVCKQDVPVLQWNEHIGREHNYLAWEDGATPLNVDDEEAVWNHLQNFIRHYDGLLCYKCGLNRKRVKLYLSHVKTCNGEGVSFDDSVMDDGVEDESPDEKKWECGVCHVKVPVMEWNEHIGREHNYLAWKKGATPLDINDEDAVKEHLLEIIRSCEGLICYKCGLNRRRAKLYLAHIKTCDGTERMDESTNSINNDSTLNCSEKVEINVDLEVKCGVCDQDLTTSMWIDHIRKEHEYIAWIKGVKPLNTDDEDEVKAHLIKISRDNNGLICNKCGITKKYPKKFLVHIKECTGEVLHVEKPKVEYEISSFDISDVTSPTVVCGVCNNKVDTSEWLNHIEEEHDYIAWLHGKPPLDLDDSAMIQKHLIEVSKAVGGLKCKKCGLVRKYAKTYLHHVDNCGTDEATTKLNAAMLGKEPVECAVCSAKVDPKNWRDHAIEEHYNVAWIVGATPIEINNPYGVEPYIKEYQTKYNNKLICKRCGITRISAVGFYAHIITCGKTEEEMEIYKKLCDICNSKYLCIYKSQHMTMHREQEYALERKLLISKEKEVMKEEDEPVEIVGGRRKAAEKAKTVIEKYTSNRDEDGVHCPKCGFTCESDSEMSDHVCVEQDFGETDSEISLNLDYSSEDDDDDDIDSNISDEEREAQYNAETKSKKHGDSSGASKIQRLPYQVRNINTYMRKSAEEFIQLHLTNDDLFPQWRILDYEVVSEDELCKYMPPVEESCKVRYTDNGDWMTYKRFEAKKENDIVTMFMGACIQSMCWVPTRVNDDEESYRQYISVVTHLDSDVPRHNWHEKPIRKPGLVQIWDCGNLVAGVPEFAMGLVLDSGVAWAIDWCPSGARDELEPNEENQALRLGLLAVACSNGSAYVFAMPHPSSLKEKGQLFCKLKPVLEMRLAMDANRNVFQATAIKWSAQKGHSQIIVGYSDGTMAYFDLLNESPLLKSTENGVTILYPFYDERAQIMCIEDVDVFPGGADDPGLGAVSCGSVAGASARVFPPGAARLLPTHAAATRVMFPPHWPAPLLAGDDNLVCINELEWYGAGRRAGSMRAAGGCTWCGRVASLAAPVLRLMRAHPAYTELHRQVIGTLQMIPFGSKRKRKNDELSMIMEPLTYNDAVSKYGIEFQRITAKDKNTQQKLSSLPRETFPERFPLSDVTSMAFCPSARNHHKLAMATHAGFIFIINV